MIIVWDNGQEAEDHDIDFIEVGDLPPAVVLEVLGMHEPHGWEIGRVPTEKFVWSKDRQACALDEHCVYLSISPDPWPFTVEEKLGSLQYATLCELERILRHHTPSEWEESVEFVHAEMSRRMWHGKRERACDVCKKVLWTPGQKRR